MKKYTTEERIEYLRDKIEFIVSNEPSMLNTIERIIFGLCAIDDEVIHDEDKLSIMYNTKFIKDRRSVETVRIISNQYSLRDLRK